MLTRYAVLCAVGALALLSVAGLVSRSGPALGPQGSGPRTPGTAAAAAHGPAKEITLSNLVGRFVDTVPRRGSEAFDVPTASEMAAFADGVSAARDGRLARARSVLDRFRYDVVEAVDRRAGRVLLVQERRNPDGTWPHGWGLYVISVREPGSLLVQIPHPVFDIRTPELGVAAFRRAGSGTLFVAGTHRYANADESSDVAHSEATMFQAVTRALAGPDSTVLQFHGFAEHDTPEAGDVVVSDGAAPPSPLSREVADELRARGFATCLYDGTACAALAGTTNVQGRLARTVGAEFLHLETSRSVREDADRRTELARRSVDAIDRH